MLPLMVNLFLSRQYLQQDPVNLYFAQSVASMVERGSGLQECKHKREVVQKSQTRLQK
jgi:hypothetical protein